MDGWMHGFQIGRPLYVHDIISELGGDFYTNVSKNEYYIYGTGILNKRN